MLIIRLRDGVSRLFGNVRSFSCVTGSVQQSHKSIVVCTILRQQCKSKVNAVAHVQSPRPALTCACSQLTSSSRRKWRLLQLSSCRFYPLLGFIHSVMHNNRKDDAREMRSSQNMHCYRDTTSLLCLFTGFPFPVLSPVR